MISFLKDKPYCKILAVVLSVFIGVEATYLFAQETDPLTKYKIARLDYLDGDYINALATCESIIEVVDETKPENKTFLACVYLLIGASNEKLDREEAARKSYAKAKELLEGKEPACEGLSLETLAIYFEYFGGPGERTEVEIWLTDLGMAKQAYFAEDYAGAKITLEKLIATLAPVAGYDTLKGEVDLLMGAT
jgi:tetratricopeptide (TPR) repeat protein